MFSALVLAALWAVVLWRVPTVWQDRWKRAPWIALTGLAVALTVDLPSVAMRVDHAADVADLSTLVKHLATIIASAAVLDWVAALNRPHRPARLLWGHASAALTMAALIALFAVMPRPETPDFITTVRTAGVGAAYLLVMYVYLGSAMAVTTVLFWRVARRAPGGTLRWGMWLLAAGTSGGACYSAYQVAFLAIRVCGLVRPSDTGPGFSAGTVLENVSIALILAGMSVPACGVAWQAARDLASARALHGIWRDLAGAVPGVAEPLWRPRGPGSAVRYPKAQLIRRVTEIRDAALSLRRQVPGTAVAAARELLTSRGLTGKQLDAAAEACWLELAIQARRDGPGDELAPHVFRGASTLQEEVRWLRLVAAATRSEDVRAVTREVSAEAVGRLLA